MSALNKARSPEQVKSCVFTNRGNGTIFQLFNRTIKENNRIELDLLFLFKTVCVARLVAVIRESIKCYISAHLLDLLLSTFRSLLENPWHNSSFEGSGFVRLFLPTNPGNQDFFSE